MYKELDDKEIQILNMIKDSPEPIGSWNIVNRMAEDSIDVSSATIGRILNKLESMGYLQKEKFRGRVITDMGLRAILFNKQLRDIATQQSKLNKYLDPQVLDDYLTVLEARRTIERETARLAALRANPCEIQQLEQILSRQENKYKAHLWIANDDLSFHRTIARASKNSILETMYGFLGIFGQQSRAFECLRTQVNAEYMVSHRRIFNAIKAGDEKEAESAMLNHIDSLIDDVNKYWEECLKPEIIKDSAD